MQPLSFWQHLRCTDFDGYTSREGKRLLRAITISFALQVLYLKITRYFGAKFRPWKMKQHSGNDSPSFFQPSSDAANLEVEVKLFTELVNYFIIKVLGRTSSLQKGKKRACLWQLRNSL